MSIVIAKTARITLLLFLLITNWGTASANVFVNPRSTQLNLYLGSFKAEEENGILENASSNVAFGFGSSSRSRHHPFLAIDVELWGLESEYRNTLPPPLFVSVNDDMLLTTSAITFGARLLYPYDTPFNFYLSGGYGYYLSNMRVYADLLGIPGYYEDSSKEFAPYFGAGLTVNLGHRQTLEVFYRKWDIRGDFSKFNIPDTDIGGEAIGIGFGMYW